MPEFYYAFFGVLAAAAAGLGLYHLIAWVYDTFFGGSGPWNWPGPSAELV